MITFTHNINSVVFYVDRHSYCPVKTTMDQLFKENSKDARIILNKFNDYIQALKDYGANNLPNNYAKHIIDNIWELRPKRYRILFAQIEQNKYILLHCFFKTTQKTPRKEIEKAIKELYDYKERIQNEKEIKI